MKLWGGRFKEGPSKLLEEFTFSFDVDKRLFKYEVLLNIAHAKMLKKCKIIPRSSADKIVAGLNKILKDGIGKLSQSSEDIHTAIEEKLHKMVGEEAGYLHTAKSRNDQVATSTRMYLKEEILNIKLEILRLEKVILSLSEKNIDIIMPGFTHLQGAQVILLSHYLLAFFEMFKRDFEMIENVYKACDVMPLGSCAMAGTSYNIDRNYLAKELKFSQVSRNSIDSVSDRDFIIQFISCISILFMHLSRFCEDLILWSSNEFSFCEISDDYATGSSILPQKKNPDVLEIIRGRTGRIYANLIGILTVMKGLPLSYNRDMQEDKIYLFSTVDIAKKTLNIFCNVLEKIKFNKEKMQESTKNGFLVATDMADYLVRKKVPFRKAHTIVGNIVKYCIDNEKKLCDLTLEELNRFSDKFSKDIFDIISAESSINNKKSYGSTSKKEVLFQIEEGKKWLNGL